MIPVSRLFLDGNEKAYLAECIDSGWVSSEGPFVQRFEEGFARYLNRKHAVTVVNGTVALEVAIRALGIGPGDEVILPTFAIVSCLLGVIRAGAVPVFVDSEPDTWNMRLDQVEESITPKTKAVLAVHTYGLPIDMDALSALRDRHGFLIIEDCAEVIGQEVRGVPCGSIADAAVMSFYANKHVTTGEGGMILCDDDSAAERCRSYRNLCFQSGAKRFVHEEFGWNYRMSNLQAAVGTAQLERLPRTVERKREVGRWYLERLAHLEPLIQLPLARTDFAENIFWVVGIVLGSSIEEDAARFIERLAARGIGSRPFFFPGHEQPALRKLGFGRETGRYPEAERLARRGLYIPAGPDISQGDRVTVVRAVEAALTEARA